MAPASLFSFVDNYCERTAIGFWNEPLNAITNISFLIAAGMLYRLYRAKGQKDRDMESLIVCIALVGLGSFAFHTYANYFAMMADVFPIIVFVCYYLWLAFRRLLGLRKPGALGGVSGFLLIAGLFSNLPPQYSVNGSVSYFPCLAALVGIGGYLHHFKHPAYRLMLTATACFIVSLTLRSIDQAVCSYIPIGTHFLWHILNGIVLYLLGKSVLKTAAYPSAS